MNQEMYIKNTAYSVKGDRSGVNWTHKEAANSRGFKLVKTRNYSDGLAYRESGSSLKAVWRHSNITNIMVYTNGKLCASRLVEKY
jgi:hypothetical protein